MLEMHPSIVGLGRLDLQRRKVTVRGFMPVQIDLEQSTQRPRLLANQGCLTLLFLSTFPESQSTWFFSALNNYLYSATRTSLKISSCLLQLPVFVKCDSVLSHPTLLSSLSS